MRIETYAGLADLIQNGRPLVAERNVIHLGLIEGDVCGCPLGMAYVSLVGLERALAVMSKDWHDWPAVQPWLIYTALEARFPGICQTQMIQRDFYPRRDWHGSTAGVLRAIDNANRDGVLTTRQICRRLRKGVEVL